MSEEFPVIGSLASIDPNKVYPIDISSPASVKGLWLLGSVAIFGVCWAILAVAIYFFYARNVKDIWPSDEESGAAEKKLPMKDEGIQTDTDALIAKRMSVTNETTVKVDPKRRGSALARIISNNTNLSIKKPEEPEKKEKQMSSAGTGTEDLKKPVEEVKVRSQSALSSRCSSEVTDGERPGTSTSFL